MPYIPFDEREALNHGDPIKGPGELNYLITMLIKRYWVNSSQRYRDLNDIVGAIESAKAEFQRRVVVPYEEAKIKSNGDCY